MVLHPTDPRTVPFHRFCHDTCRVEFEHFPISCDHTRPWIDVPRHICCNCDEPLSDHVMVEVDVAPAGAGDTIITKRGE